MQFATDFVCEKRTIVPTREDLEQQCRSLAGGGMADVKEGEAMRFPRHSWAMATLPNRYGGIGALDPEQRSVGLFLRPLMRSLRTVTQGFLIRDYSAPQPTSKRIPFPTTINEPFTNWTNSPLPWIQRFFSLLHDVMSPDHPDLDTVEWATAKKSKTNSTLKNICEQQALTNYQQQLTTFPAHFTTVERSLRSHFTSFALTSLPLAPLAHRTPPTIYITMLKRKLRLPIIPEPIKCKCGKQIDTFCDHLLSCKQHSKKLLHNRLRDAFALVCNQLAPNAGIVASHADVSREPTSMLPSIPLHRPADICLHLQPHVFPSWSHIFIDVTTIPFCTSSRPDPNPIPVERLHECAENKKFRGPNYEQAEFLSDMLQHRYVLLPCTLDSGGLLGPLFSTFLYGQTTPHHSILQISKPRSKRNLSNPRAKELANRALSIVPSPGIFIQANSNWRESHPTTSFTEHFPLDLPSQWATSVIGNNINQAIGRHIEYALAVTSNTNQSATYEAAACHPRIPKARFPLLPSYSPILA